MKKVGIIGGLGPMAMVYFLLLISSTAFILTIALSQ